MTATHQGYHAFTAPKWLGAKEPDHLTTCNTVESERCVVRSKVNHAENDQKFYRKEMAVPKNIAPSICCAVVLPPSTAIAVERTRQSRRDDWWSGKLTTKWKHYGVLNYIRDYRSYLVIGNERGSMIERWLLTWILRRSTIKKIKDQKWYIKTICHIEAPSGICWSSRKGEKRVNELLLKWILNIAPLCISLFTSNCK